MNNFNKNMLFVGLTFCSLGAHAQAFKEGYVSLKDVESSKFHTTVMAWDKNKKVSDDDNFFISRGKPKVRFRNKATQVRNTLVHGCPTTTHIRMLCPMVTLTQRFSRSGAM